MPRHAGDPRSDQFGEIPFDQNEYPGPPPTPPALPPLPPNMLGGVPYRGREQHGVLFDEPPQDNSPLAAEERALAHYTDQQVRPTDIVPVKPVPVSVVDVPNLILPLNISFQSYRLAPSTSTFSLVATAQQLRKRVRISVVDSASGSVSAYLANSPDAITSGCKFVAATSGVVALLDSATTDSLYVQVVAANSGTAVVSVETEFHTYDDVPLL